MPPQALSRAEAKRLRALKQRAHREAAGLFLAIAWLTRYISLASIAATLALPPTAWSSPPGEPADRR